MYLAREVVAIVNRPQDIEIEDDEAISFFAG